MTNMGFNKFCEENDMHFVSTKVGDRYVLEAMMQEGYNIGGEQSGHIICLTMQQQATVSFQVQ